MGDIPERIGKYEVVRRIGYGGMGAVYLARDPDLDRQLAIKVLREIMLEDEVIQRFLREARAAGNLRHENVITVYDAGQHDHQPFMAMEYVDGVSFAEMIRSRQQLPLADKLSYLEQICSGLHYAHGQGIVHRDIKPANLMVDRRNVVRILDFGIARVEGSGMTRDGALIGTLNYMSPEQMLGRAIDHRSDVFAFGAVAYELLTYAKAFPGTIQDGLLQRLPNEPPTPMSELCPGLPDELEPVVMRALAKLPQDRFNDLEEARTALRRIRRQLNPDLDLEPIPAPRRGGAGAVSTPTPGSPSERTDKPLSVQRYLTEADIRLSHGEVESADGLVRQALRLEPDNAAALALRSRIEQAATSGGIVLPTMIVPKGKDPTGPSAGAGSDSGRRFGTRAPAPEVAAPATPAPDVRQRSPLPIRRVALAGAVAAAVIVAGVLWFSSRDDGPTPSSEPTARVDRPAAPDPPARTPPVPADPAPGPAVESERLLQDQLARIDSAYKKGDLEGALVEMRPVLARTTDERARTLARAIASDARRRMTTAAAAARKQKAADLSPGVFATAERARTLSEEAFGRGDFVESGIQAVRATANYSYAEREAAATGTKVTPSPQPAPRIADADKPQPPPTGAPPVPSAAPPGVVTNLPAPVPVPAPAPAAVPSPTPPPIAATPPAPAATPNNAASAARASAIEIERAGMLRAINRYQDAYRNRSVKELEGVYPSLAQRREERQDLERSFSKVCRTVDFIYLNPQFNFNIDDPGAGTVTTRTTFTCEPGTGQKPIVVSGPQVFILRKAGETWLIDRIITDAATR